jgi:hypothetical protein
MRYFKWIYLSIIMTLSVGCYGSKPSKLSIDGVVMSNNEISGPVIGPIKQMKPREGDFAIPGAIVYVSQTNDWREPIPGFQVETDKDGFYRIELTNIPTSSDAANEFLLVVKKDRYHPFTERIRVSAFFHYLENTIWLEPVQGAMPTRYSGWACEPTP